MKKLLLGIITILVMALIIVTAINGLQIGKFKILGIKEIKTKDAELDTTIQKATKLASTDYQKKIDDLNNTIKKLETERTSYEDMVNVSTESEVEAANQSYDNMIEFLLVRIENHAKSEGVTMKMDVTKSSSGAENVYNLNFTVTGTYVGIEEFITDVEDDSKLGYKIEDFKMIASSENGNTVQATFVCKNISIGGISESVVSTQNTTDTTNKINNATTNTNTTNTTNDTKTNTNTENTTSKTDSTANNNTAK